MIQTYQELVEEAIAEKTIGDRIRKLRLAKKMTQEQLSNIETLKVQRNLVNYWENNERDINMNHIIALSKFFEVSCDAILLGINAENAALSREYEGLSNKSLEFIKYLDSKPQSQIPMDYSFKHRRSVAANALFEDAEFFDLIYAFINFNPERYKLLGNESILSVCKIDDVGMPIEAIVTGYTPEDLSFALFAKIQQALIRIRNAINHTKDTDAKKARANE